MSDIKQAVRDWVRVTRVMPGITLMDWHALTNEEQAAIMAELRISMDPIDRPIGTAQVRRPSVASDVELGAAMRSGRFGDPQPASYGQVGAAVRSQFEDSAIRRVVVELNRWELPPDVKSSADAATKVRALVDYLACTRKRLSEAFEANESLLQKRDDDAKMIAYLRSEVANLNERIDLLVNPDADR